MKRKDYTTAILLNLFFPGAGYIYAGRIFLGVVVLLMALGAAYGALNGSQELSGVVGILSIIGAVDGYLTVKKHNDRADAASLITCPNCAEKIQRGAKVCKYCQRQVAA